MNRFGMAISAAWLLLLAICPGVSAMDTLTRTFDSAFRTLRVEVEGDFMATPVIDLDGDRRITVSFDEIGDDFSELRYRLVHCNADWQPSQLVESEYVEGFNEADVDDYAFSSNTFVHFVNYRITVPSEDMRPLVSGNYLLQVFDRYDPERVLLQARFSVSENVVSLSGEVSGRTDRGLNTEWQQLELALSPGDFMISNPYTDLNVTVTQNSLPESTRTLPPPSRLEGQRMIWQHLPALVFGGGNEFRRFETVRLAGPGMHVDSMRFGGTNYHAYLMTDADRSEREYVYDSTQRGRYLVRDYVATDADLGADYVTVHFTLDFPQITNGDIYIDGDLTNHLREEPYRMIYDHSRHLYTLDLPLKQGSYNYRYVAVPRVSGGSVQTADPGVVEGNFFETVNEYDVRAYYRPPGARYDRLIGTALLTTAR
ncbi:MAG: DUF5103 domain-containing protein [Muribaculaceae bacterium]|nr:DUF5103 domain-containing protein [Muribaculaceae bacterium]